MDMQGTPIGSSGQGMKNTSDPSAKLNPKEEGPGAITSDSLAAESARSGGGFSENRNSEPLSVSGSNSTFNNTDTSGATKLPPAPDAQTRYADVASNAENTSYPEQLGGQGNNGGGGSRLEGTGSSQNQGRGQGQNQVSGRDEAPFGTKDTDTSTHGVSGAKAAQASMGTSGSDNASGSGSGSGSGSASNNNTSSFTSSSTGNNNSSQGGNKNNSGNGGNDNDNNIPVDSAPGYISSVYSEPTKSGKPHGKNITEGGFDSNDDNNASFTSDVGGKDDPGRKAVGDFQKMSQSVSGDTGPRQQPPGGDGQQQGGFENLGQE